MAIFLFDLPVVGELGQLLLHLIFYTCVMVVQLHLVLPLLVLQRLSLFLKDGPLHDDGRRVDIGMV